MSEPDLGRVELAILVALTLEAEPLVASMAESVRLRAGRRTITVGTLGSRRVAVLAAGVGRDAARLGVQMLVEGHRPGALLAAGLCGGLDPGLPHGRVLLADEVVLAEGRPFVPDPLTGILEPPDRPEESAEAGEPPISRGRVVTSDSVVATPQAKRDLRAECGAAAVDMESWWIAEAATEAEVPWASLRVVSDTAAERIPDDVAALAATAHPARLAGAAMRLLFRRPAAIGDFAELRERACQAADSLAAAMVRLLR